jgi:hypothetical protein
MDWIRQASITHNSFILNFNLGKTAFTECTITKAKDILTQRSDGALTSVLPLHFIGASKSIPPFFDVCFNSKLKKDHRISLPTYRGVQIAVENFHVT